MAQLYDTYKERIFESIRAMIKIGVVKVFYNDKTDSYYIRVKTDDVVTEWGVFNVTSRIHNGNGIDVDKITADVRKAVIKNLEKKYFA